VSSRRGAGDCVEPQVFDLARHSAANLDGSSARRSPGVVRGGRVGANPRQRINSRAPMHEHGMDVIFPSTMFWTLDFKPNIQLVGKVIHEKVSVCLACLLIAPARRDAQSGPTRKSKCACRFDPRFLRRAYRQSRRR